MLIIRLFLHLNLYLQDVECRNNLSHHLSQGKLQYHSTLSWALRNQGWENSGKSSNVKPIGELCVNFVTGGSEEYSFQKSQEESMEGLGSRFVNISAQEEGCFTQLNF